MLAAVGIAIAFGPEIRVAVARIRRDELSGSESLSQSPADVR